LIRNAARNLRIEDLLEYPPYQLSLCQKKKVAIAGLMVLEPDIIVCDEPFSGLDGYTLLYFKGLLNDWVASGETIVFSTDDVDLTYEWADNVIILKEGKVQEMGSVQDILTKDATYSEAGLVKPMLYQLFNHCDYKPRDIKAAQEYIRQLSFEA